MNRNLQPSQNKRRPQVSVIMPLLNAMPFLKDAIASILSQSLSDLELIVVDNGSTDGSRQYAESLQDERIRVLTESRPGAAHAINAGIRAGTAEFAAIMDADDISLPDRLALELDYLRNHPDVVLVATRFSFLVGNTVVPVAPPMKHHSEIRQALLDGASPISEGSTMFRISAARQIGGHSFNGPAHDFDFFLRMGEIGILHNLQEPMYLYRLHNQSSTTKTTSFIMAHKRHAIACARARAAGRPEPVLSDLGGPVFFRQPVVALTDRVHGMADCLYRRAIIGRASGKRLVPGIGLACCAMLNPRRAWWRLKRQVAAICDRSIGAAKAGRPSLLSGT